MNQPIAISGLVPFSATDYPGQLAAVVFCQGCPWRCRYCHNPHLLPFTEGTYDWQSFLQFAQSRCGFLDAIVFSGGEATAQPHLREAIIDIKSLGYKIGLHTSGYSSARLRSIIDVIDWVGLDIKGKEFSESFESLKLLTETDIAFETRTTFHPMLMSEVELIMLARMLRESGVKDYAVQLFQPNGCTDSSLCDQSVALSDSTVKTLQGVFPNFTLRN